MVSALFVIQAIYYTSILVVERHRSILEAGKLFATFNWLRVVPFNLFYVLGYAELDHLFLTWIQQEGYDLTGVVGRYVLFNCLAFTLTWLMLRKYKPSVRSISLSISKKQARVVMFLGVLGVAGFVSSQGGIVLLLSNLTERVSMQSGSLLIKMRPLAVIGFLLLYHVDASAKTNSIKYYLTLSIIILSLTLTGGRKDALLLLLYIFLYNVRFKGQLPRVNLTFKNIVLGIIIGIFILIMPIVRSARGTEGLESIDFTEVLANFGEITEYLNYSYIEMYVYSHFDRHNFWRGASISSLGSMFARELPSNERPPLDEGVYVTTSMMCSCDVTPPKPREQLNVTSYPLENVGTFYANGLLPGLIFGSLLLGFFIKTTERVFARGDKHGIGFFIYLWSVLDFNFSVLRISSSIILLASIIITLVLPTLRRLLRRI